MDAGSFSLPRRIWEATFSSFSSAVSLHAQESWSLLPLTLFYPMVRRIHFQSFSCPGIRIYIYNRKCFYYFKRLNCFCFNLVSDWSNLVSEFECCVYLCVCYLTKCIFSYTSNDLLNQKIHL